MSYCINPKCPNPQEAGKGETCQHCGTALLINGRYRVDKPLRAPSRAYATDIYEVIDWGGVDADWGATKVLKVLKYISNPDLVRLFQQEARVLMFLRDDGFPRVEPDGYFTFSPHKSNQKLHCIVMEKIEGENLSLWLHENGPISIDDALNWLQILTELLNKLHKSNVGHRDIKPSNIILRPDGGTLTLIDFGTVGVDNWGDTCIGTSGYAAPEQITGDSELRSDFFALGRTFVELLTGIPPIDFPTDEKTGRLLWRQKAKTLNFNNILDKLFADLLDNLMEPAYEKRPRNTQQILKQIAQIIHTSKLSPKQRAFKKSLKIASWIAVLFVSGFILNTFAGDIQKFWNYLAKEDKNLLEPTNNVFQQMGTDNYGKDNNKAMFYYQMALLLNSKNAAAHYSVARICEDKKETDCAKNHYLAALDGENIDAAVASVSNLSRIKILEGNYDEVIAMLTPYLDKAENPRIKAALYKNLGWAEYIKGEMQKAEAHLTKAVELINVEPKYRKWSSPHCLLALVLESKGDKPAALGNWNYCLEFRQEKADREEDKAWQTLAQQRINQSKKQP